MKTYRIDNLKITLEQEGSRSFAKASYPIRYGRYSAIEQGDFLFQYNLNGEAKYISGSGPDWPHPAEWLKRTSGNDWVYYSTGKFLKKPVSSAVMQKAFAGMLAINRCYENIEVTANFLLGDDLPAGHIPTLAAHIAEARQEAAGKGCIYISPLRGSQNTKEILKQLREIKTKSRIQTFLYLIKKL